MDRQNRISEAGSDRGRIPVVLVSGASEPGEREFALAEETGRLLAEAGMIVLTGGMGGVMDAASRGARAAGGRTVAVLPGRSAKESRPNPHVEVAIFTGMSEARNAILAHTADAVIAIGGGWGTLSEIALARKSGRPVIRLATWEVIPPGASTETGAGATARTAIPEARSAEEAVRMAVSSIQATRASRSGSP